MERVKGIEPSSPAWKAGALATMLHPHWEDARIMGEEGGGGQGKRENRGRRGASPGFASRKVRKVREGKALRTQERKEE